jgi:hypothetical protein
MAVEVSMAAVLLQGTLARSIEAARDAGPSLALPE